MERHGPFIPTSLKEWKPEHMRGRPSRMCHWCAQHKRPIADMIIVLEAPMRFYFCEDQCYSAWQLQRFEPEVSAWLRNDVGTRHKILSGSDDA